MQLFPRLKSNLRRHTPQLFFLLKKMARTKLIKKFYYQIYPYLFPPTERYDPFSDNPGDDYFNAYANHIPHMAYGHVLDLGCGYGYLTRQIAQQSNVRQVVAVDNIEPSAFRFLNHPKIIYYQKNIKSLSAAFGQFDVIVSTEFVEHITEKDFLRLLHYIRKSLKPAGVFIGSTPKNTTKHQTFSGSPHHLREYQPEYFKNLLLTHGFNTVTLTLLDDIFLWKATL